MTHRIVCLALLMGLLLVSPAEGQSQRKGKHAYAKVNSSLQGTVLDFTKNHGVDHRIYSPALKMKRDLYVYLPPNYDPDKKYPLILWLHGFAQDELSFLHKVAPAIDRAIVEGILPPVIAVAPDGSLGGRATVLCPGSFYLNGPRGNYQDYLMEDVWNFAFTHFTILPEREAHVIAGVSMGGCAAYNKAFQYPDRFGTIAGVLPPLNLRWKDCNNNYLTPFDPACWGWRTDFRKPFEVVADFGIIKIRQWKIIGPLFPGMSNEEIVAEVTKQNPIEMLERLNIKPGQYNMYVGYVGMDEFNINTQVESFLYRSKERNIPVSVTYHPDGHHNGKSCVEFYPDLFCWIGKQLQQYKTPPSQPNPAPSPSK